MDSGQRIVEAILEARTRGHRLNIIGAGSKRQWLPQVSGELLGMSEHRGITAYEPTELVVSVRAGTSIRELVSELAQSGQELAFEPPQFFGAGTAGGMVACGLSGPARPWAGSVRDAVLGVELVNGLGECLKFGGQVMKNVAGYDVSRLAAGAYGALGALLEISLRVQPVREHTLTLHFDLDAQAANDKCRELARRYLPITGSWWTNHQLWLRLAGTAAGVNQAAVELGGEQVTADNLWQDIADHKLSYFKPSAPDGVAHGGEKLWRMVVPPAAPVPHDEAGSLALEWGGGLRWLWHADAEFVTAYVQQHKGWAWSLGDPLRLEATQQKYMRAIKAAFDPDSLFVSPLEFGSDGAH